MATDPTIEHVLCGACHPDVYLCGTPRLAAEQETFVTLGEEHDQTPCAVCFAQPIMTCSNCLTRIRTAPPMVESIPAVVGWIFLFFAALTLTLLAIRGGAA